MNQYLSFSGNQTSRSRIDDESVPEITIPINQYEEREYSWKACSAWILLALVWIGIHVSILFFVVSDKNLDEAIKIWTILMCGIELFMSMIGPIIFRNLVRILSHVYDVECMTTITLMVIYLPQTMSSDLLLILSVFKMILLYAVVRITM